MSNNTFFYVLPYLQDPQSPRWWRTTAPTPRRRRGPEISQCRHQWQALTWLGASMFCPAAGQGRGEPRQGCRAHLKLGPL